MRSIRVCFCWRQCPTGRGRKNNMKKTIQEMIALLVLSAVLALLYNALSPTSLRILPRQKADIHSGTAPGETQQAPDAGEQGTPQ